VKSQGTRGTKLFCDGRFRMETSPKHGLIHSLPFLLQMVSEAVENCERF
jgi:hypothetical protein